MWWYILGGVLLIAALYLFSYTTTEESGPLGSATTSPTETKPKPPSTPRVVTSPRTVEQGEAVIITALGIATTTDVASFTFDNRPLNSFLYNGYVTAFLGVDLHAATGTFPLLLTFKDGSSLRGDLVIHERLPEVKDFEIPAKLGGNTPESIRSLIQTLAEEGRIINALPSLSEVLWTDKFRFPLDGAPVIDDVYGYTRVIGNFTMPHKGTDYRAEIGTPVYAMNVGVVRLASSLRNYGNTVVLDHGAGVQSVYMHLKETRVTVGQKLEKGELLGLSGDTGYTIHPHLHLSIKIWDIAINPVGFLELFGEER